VGSLGGAFQRKLRTDDEAAEEEEDADDGWHTLGRGLPPAFVRDLHYNAANNILVAGTLGRGAWTLPNLLKGHTSGLGDAAIPGIDDQPTMANNSRVETSWAEANELSVEAEMVPPVAIRLAEDE